MTAKIRDCCSTKFALDLNTKSGNLSEVNKIAALIGPCTLPLGKIMQAASGS